MNRDEHLSFPIVKKGYDTAEVDAYIEELESKLSYYQTRTQEVEQKLETCHRLIRRFSGMENDLRQNIADSKRAAATMLSDTQERSNTLLDEAREECGAIISDLDAKLAEKMNTVDLMKASVSLFKEQLFDMYSSHIQMIETLASNAENFTYEPDYSTISASIEKFEEAGAPTATLPEFSEYPQENIFDGILEDEKAKDKFVLETTESQSFEAKPETDDYTIVEPIDQERLTVEDSHSTEESFVKEEYAKEEEVEIQEEDSFSFDSDDSASVDQVLSELGKAEAFEELDDEESSEPSEFDTTLPFEKEFIDAQSVPDVFFDGGFAPGIPDATYDPELDSAFNEVVKEDSEDIEDGNSASDDDYYKFLSNFINSDD